MKIVSASIQNSLRHVVSTLKNTNIFKAHVAVPWGKVGSGGGGEQCGGQMQEAGRWRQSPASAPSWPVVGPEEQLGSWLVHAGVGAVRGLVRLGHAGAAHRDGDVVFGVH